MWKLTKRNLNRMQRHLVATAGAGLLAVAAVAGVPAAVDVPAAQYGFWTDGPSRSTCPYFPVPGGPCSF